MTAAITGTAIVLGIVLGIAVVAVLVGPFVVRAVEAYWGWADEWMSRRGE